MNVEADTFHGALIQEQTGHDISDASLIPETRHTYGDRAKLFDESESSGSIGVIKKPFDLSPADILFQTTCALARNDYETVGVYIELLNDGKISDNSREQIESGAKQIQKMLSQSRKAEPQDTNKALSTAQDILNTSEKLIVSILRIEMGILPDSEYSICSTIGSTLDADSLLD
jgi:hypothetical protein